MSNKTLFRKTNKLLYSFALILLLNTVVGVSAGIVSNPKPYCTFGDLRFDLNFPSARINECQQTGKREYSLVTAPENQPVNHSPWYSFKVYSEKSQEITVYLHYTAHQHRYHPKVSNDGEVWTRVADRNIESLFEGKTIKLKLKVGPKPLWVSGQEVFDNQDYDTWTNELDARGYLKKSLMGKSVEGRDISKVETLETGQKKYIILVGRQHPPEITGAIAMKAFVNRVFADDKLAKNFREVYGILMVPNLNPDGVYHGHWRHNVNGIDLNRDWGLFKQPETSLIRDELARFKTSNGPNLNLFLDFHSTAEDLFYTQFDGVETVLPNFTATWFAAINKRIQAVSPGYKVDRQPRDNANNTSRSYMYNTFGIPAMTFELGDHTDRQFIQAFSTVAAEEMMKQLLSYP